MKCRMGLHSIVKVKNQVKLIKLIKLPLALAYFDLVLTTMF